MATGRRWLEEEIQAVHPSIWGLLRESRAPAADVEYVVVDEIEEDVATLVVEPWPYFDQRGRLNFSGSELRQDVQVETQQFEQLLEDRVAPGQLPRLSWRPSPPVRYGWAMCFAPSSIESRWAHTPTVLPAGYSARWLMSAPRRGRRPRLNTLPPLVRSSDPIG